MAANSNITFNLVAKDKASATMDRFGKGVQKQSKFANGLKIAAKGAVVAAAAAAAAAVVVGQKLIVAGERASTSNSRIGQIATSMNIFGDSADDVTGRLVKLAEQQARQTGIDQNAIKSTQAKLLTFKELAGSADNVGGAFDRATTAAIDLEAAGFGSAEQAAVQLGKALNDPTKGISALNEVGLTFTETEQKKIKAMQEAGDMAGAQSVILDALETQVGGTAAATANMSDRMGVAWSQVQEKLGTKLLPLFEKFSGFVIEKGMPALMDLADRAQTHLVPVFNRLSDWFKNEGLPRLQEFASFIQAEVLPRIISFASWVGGTLVPNLKSAGQWVNRNRTWLLGLAAPIVAIVAAWQIYQKTLIVVKSVQAAYNTAMAAGRAIQQAYMFGTYGQIAGNTTLAGTVAAVTGALRTKLVAMGQSFAAGMRAAASTVAQTTAMIAQRVAMMAVRGAMLVATAAQWAWNAALMANPIGLVIAAIAALVAGLVWFFTQTETGQKVWAGFTSFLTSSWEWIKDAFSKGVGAVTGFLQRAWDFIKKVWSFSPLGLIVSNWSKITGAFSTGVGKVRGWLQGAWDFIKKVWSFSPLGLITGNWDKIIGFFKKVPGKLTTALSSVADKIFAPFKRAFNWVANGWNNSVGKLSFSVPDIPGVPGRGQTFSFPKIPQLAKGGILTRPTVFLGGEGGETEVVQPLSKLDQFMRNYVPRDQAAYAGGRGGGDVYVDLSGTKLELIDDQGSVMGTMRAVAGQVVKADRRVATAGRRGR